MLCATRARSKIEAHSHARTVVILAFFQRVMLSKKYDGRNHELPDDGLRQTCPLETSWLQSVKYVPSTNNTTSRQPQSQSTGLALELGGVGTSPSRRLE